MAREWVEAALSGAETVGFAWLVLLAYVRLATRAGVFPHPLALDDALDDVESWLAQPPAVVLHPTPRHIGVLHGLLAPVGAAGNLVNDAHLAALATEHGADVVSFDGDFARFPGVRWHNLAGTARPRRKPLGD